MVSLWSFITKPTNRLVISWVGGGIVAVATVACTPVFVHSTAEEAAGYQSRLTAERLAAEEAAAAEVTAGASLGALAGAATGSLAGAFAGQTTSEKTIEPFFPWPPPQPFLYELMPRQAFSANVKTLSEISELLKSELANAGYSDFRFFSIRSNGFALVTRMERIDAHWHPIAGAGRWEDSGGLSLDTGPFSILAYLRALFTRRAGNFRVFVMIVTPENVVPDPDKQLQPETVQDWQRRGSLSLPEVLGRLPFSDRHRVYVLVYEFRKEEGEAPKPVKDGTAAEHLNAAGVHLGNPS